MRSELLKLRHTFVPAVLLAWPITTGFLVWALLSQAGRHRAWDDIVQQGGVMWGALLLPLLIALLAAQLLALEHAPGAWRWRATLPRPRWMLALPKIAVMLALVLAASLLAALVLVAAGLLLGAVGPVPWAHLFGVFVLEWLCSVGVQILLLAVAFRFPTFLAPTGVGAIATVVAVFAMQSDRYGPWWPWAASALGMMDPQLRPQLVAFALAVAALASSWLILSFGRRDL